SCPSCTSARRCRRLLAEGAVGGGAEAGAAVLVPLCSVRGRPALLYTLRCSRLRGPYGGDVSFPGGKREAADGGAEGTALREAREELGLKLTGCLWSPWWVTPYAASPSPLPPMCVPPTLFLPLQVAEVFTLPLEHLLQEKNQGYTHFRTAGRYGYTLPVFLNGPHRIWGLTAIITELTLELLAPDLYCRKTHVPGRGITAPQKRA
uniref:Nudix hydrolase 8 n=1 Tax=Pavo cristatus TaxID=9049 RepID=A0A8C9EM49_PAVCR